MALLQGQPPPYSEAQQQAQVITNVVTVPEPNLLALAAAQNTRLPESIPEEQMVVVSAEHDANLDAFKNKIYRHALFPLLAMVFEKCEGATSFPDSTTNGFEKDLKACMKCLEGLDKPLMDGDDEINQLMIKAVQVLRIHLMEVEKVNELCKDFCARYITCLKSKLTSESLLHVEGCDSPPPLDCSPSQSLSPGMLATSPTMQQIQSSPATATAALTPAGIVNGGGVVLQQPQPPQQTQIVSGNTVYQMVRTPQGIVAQPIQIQGPLTPLPSAPAIHGSTPLSQVGIAALASPTSLPQQQQQQQQQPSRPPPPLLYQPQSQQPIQQETQQQQQQQQQQSQLPVTNSHQLSQQQQNAAALMSQETERKLLNVPQTSEEMDDEDKNGKQKRGVLPKHATQIMKTWLFQHIVHPYPTEDEKRQIASQTNLTLLQVNNWFINARRRILQPMLEVSNPDKGKQAKKTSKPVTRPQHRFWPIQASDSPSGADTNGQIVKSEKVDPAGQADEMNNSTSTSSRGAVGGGGGGGGIVVSSPALSIGAGGAGVSGAAAAMVVDNSMGGVGGGLQSDALMSLVQNSGLVLKVTPDGQIIHAGGQVMAPPPPPPPPTPGSITLDSLQALQNSGLLFAPSPSPLSFNLPFSGLAPPNALSGAGLAASFGLAGAFPGLAAAAAASIMNFNPAAAAAAYAPMSFANLNATPIDLSSVSNPSNAIQFINAANTAHQINPQLQMPMGLSYHGVHVDQSNEVQEEGGQLHIDMDNNNNGSSSSAGMGDVGD